ncbi:MAG TPA: DUF4465 domain-containing protein [Bacteroidales bacterium]|nr:DUF4465 domain-containing protein [Bacteroidales bacterium]
MMRKKLLLVLALMLSVSFVFAQTFVNLVDFESLTLAPESHYAGEDNAGGFEVDYLKFYNSYASGMWYGFAYTNETDATTPGYENQYSSASGSGVNASANYVVGYIGFDWEPPYAPIPSVITLDKENPEDIIPGMYVNLNTYASLYMAENDCYKTGNHWYKLKIVALSTTSSSFSEEAEFILADYRSDNEEMQFKISDWTYVDLTWAGVADSLLFYVESSDSWTPNYFCIDNFADTCPEIVPEFITDIETNYTASVGEPVQLSAFVKGGVQPYSFEWSNAEILDDATSQMPVATVSENTTLTVTVSDANGNTITETVNIVVSTYLNLVDFESLELEPNSHYAGEDNAGGFEADYLKFYNSYAGGMWYGFAYTNETDTTTPGYENQYSSASGSGVNASENYVVGFMASDWENNYEPIPSVLKLTKENPEDIIPGMYVNLNTYASLYMADNDFYKTENHWYKLKIVALSTTSYFTNEAEFFLADYRSDNEEMQFKIDDWTYIDLTWAGVADSLLFYVESSDEGDYGINTPAYFCIDNFADICPETVPEFITDIKTNYYIGTGESVQLSAFVKGGVQPYSFEWSNAEVLDDATSQMPVATVSENTTLTVTVSDANENTITETVNIFIGTNIAENKVFEPKVYINQNNILNIESEKEIKSLEIYDITGKQLVSKSNLYSNANIDLSYFPQGIYIVRLSDGISMYSTKIFK